MKKTIFYYFLIVLMLFAFVSCNPETNSSSENLLPGEVTSPAESKMVEASDEDISKAFSILNNGASYSGKTVTEETTSTKAEFTFDNGDTFAFSTETDDKGSVITADGKFTEGSSVYELSDYTLTYKDGKYTETGKFLKDGKEVTGEDTESFLKNLSSRYNIEGASVKYESKITYKFTVEEDSVKKDGSTLMVMSIDGDNKTMIYDITYGDDRVQNKMSGKYGAGVPTIDYIALNGKFFNAESREKLLNKMKIGY